MEYLCKFWRELYPDTSYTKQRISDQRRLIFIRSDAKNTTSSSQAPKRTCGNSLTKVEIDIIEEEEARILHEPAEENVNENTRENIEIVQPNTILNEIDTCKQRPEQRKYLY